MKIFSLIIFLIWIGFSISSFGQNDPVSESQIEKIAEAGKNLQMKLLLDNRQLELLNDILNEAAKDSVSTMDRLEVINQINEKVEAILMPKQKIKFRLLKSNWLDEVFGSPE